MNGYWLTVIMAALILGAIGRFPWYAEVGQAIRQLAPYLPLILAMWLLSGVLKDVIQGVKDFFTIRFKFVGGVLFLLVFLVMIVPVMAADTFLLGPLSHWMWKYQFGTLAVVALSAAAIGILLWKDGKLTSGFSIKYLTFFAVLGVVSIVVGWSQDYFGGVERLDVEVVNGTTYLDPAASIKLKGGDHVVVKAFGRVTAGGKDYPPQGDIRHLIQFGDWYRPTGEMQILVGKQGQPAVEAPLENIKTGAETVGGFDLYHDVGYYIEAEATVPEKAVGYLDVGWFGLPTGQPDSGFVRLTIQVNPHLTTRGRLAKLPWYIGVMGILAALLLSEIAASYLAALFSNKVWKVTVWVVAILAFVFTVAALRNVGAVDFSSTPNVADGVRTVGSWFEDRSSPPTKKNGSGSGVASTGRKALCPSDEVRIGKGEQVGFQVGDRPGCRVSAITVVNGSIKRTWVFPGGVEGPAEVLTSGGPDLPGPSKRPSAIILEGLEDNSALKAL